MMIAAIFCLNHMSSIKFFRLIEANYISPETVLKNVIKEQQQQQQQQQHHQHHHHRHQTHQLNQDSFNINHIYHNPLNLLIDGTTSSLSSSSSSETTTKTTIGSAKTTSSNSVINIPPIRTIVIDSMRTKNINNNNINNNKQEPLNVAADDDDDDVADNERMDLLKTGSLNNSHILRDDDDNNNNNDDGNFNGKDKSPVKMNLNFDVDSFVPPGYDKLMPPKQNGQPTVVRFHVWVLGLDSIDEGSMTYVADIFMSQSWKDNRLIIPDDIVYNVNTSNDPRGPYRLLPLTFIDKIWRPDSFFKNAKEVTFQEMTIPNHYIWLYSDNTILYMVKLTLLLSCAMKFQTYPHDTQNCTMKIESLSYTTKDLIFDWEESDSLVVEEHIELPQHDLINKDIDYCTTDYSSGTFACVQVVFTIKRRIGYYIFHTYIPTCLIVIMSWISFWIKPEAVPARVTLCVTSLLTLSTQHAQSQKSLPPVSYIKAIDIFMSSCTVFVFASLMEYALVNILMADELLNGWIGIAPTAYQQQPTATITTPTTETRIMDPQTKTTTTTRIKPGTHDYDDHHRNKVPNHISTHQHHYHPVRCSSSLTGLDKLELDTDSKQFSEHENDDKATKSRHDDECKLSMKCHKTSTQMPSSILRHRCCSIINDENGHNGHDDNDGIFIDNQIKHQQRRTSDRKQSYIYAFPTPSIYDDQNFCYRSWRVPPMMMNTMTTATTTTTTGVNMNYNNNGNGNINNNNIYNNNNSHNQYLLQSKHKRAYTVDYISRFIFPISFIVLNIFYWTYYLEVWETLS
nr:uncharacterized protein LOC124494889 isoform X1 [Dermatophagoides farinae]